MSTFDVYLSCQYWETGYRYARYYSRELMSGWLWDMVPEPYYDAFCEGVACGMDDRSDYEDC